MKKLIKNLKSAAAFTPLLAQASGTTIELQPKTGLASSLTNLTPAGIISALISFAIVIAALIFFFMLVIGGIRWILSGGDKAQTESARSQITAALVGLVIVFSAWAIAQLVNAFFGVNIFSLVIPKVS